MNWHLLPYSELRHGGYAEDHYRLVEYFTVQATNARGDRYLYCGPVDTRRQSDALALIDRIRAYAGSHPSWTPEDNRHWNQAHPVYGSDAYVEGGCEEAWAARERADDPFYYADAERLANSLVYRA